ncbi:hypothetical protein D3C75_582730 [compost metagenome]
MKITGRVEIEAVTDVACDVCRCSTRLDNGLLQFATLQAHWGFGSEHDGEHYELHLCEGCFFNTMAYFKQERRIHQLFSDDEQTPTDDLGLVARDDFFGDVGSR